MRVCKAPSERLEIADSGVNLRLLSMQLIGVALSSLSGS